MGVGQGLRKLVDFPQDWTPSQLKPTFLNAVRPLVTRSLVLRTRRGTQKDSLQSVEYCSHEVGHKVKLLRRRCRSLRE